jgi:hypothetical protein
MEEGRQGRKNIKMTEGRKKIACNLYVCETWCLILWEEYRRWAFENRVLRRVYEPKREEIIGGWRELRNDEPHNSYSPSNNTRIIKSRRIKLAG